MKHARPLQITTDEHVLTSWKFVVGGQVVSENPRHSMIADSVFSHLAHHRGQLTVYLRLNEFQIYGPSADEGKFAGEAVSNELEVMLLAFRAH